MSTELRGRILVALPMFALLILSFIFKEIFLIAILAISAGILFESYKIILSRFNVIFDKDYPGRLILLLFIALMVYMFFYSSYFLYLYERPLMIVMVMSIVCTDTFAYLFGKRFGKNKLAPSISPGKTWEGLLGGISASVIVFILASFFKLINFSLQNAFIWGLAISLISVFGDLFESSIKRKFEVKDSGNILGAHGGIFDRFDSYLFSIPATLILQQLLR